MPVRIGAIIQARMGSQRLPGKVLRPVGGKPVLAYLLERVRRAAQLDEVVVATSAAGEDDAIAQYCEHQQVACFRGDLHDVASRFAAVSTAWDLGAFARINGDSPLLDVPLLDGAVARFRAGGVELVTNVFPRSFPAGQSVEVVCCAAFRRAYTQFREAADCEHVTTFLYRHPEQFAIANIPSGQDYSGVRLAIDTAADLECFAAMAGLMDRAQWEYGLADIVGLYRRVQGLALAPA